MFCYSCTYSSTGATWCRGAGATLTTDLSSCRHMSRPSSDFSLLLVPALIGGHTCNLAGGREAACTVPHRRQGLMRTGLNRNWFSQTIRNILRSASRYFLACTIINNNL